MDISYSKYKEYMNQISSPDTQLVLEDARNGSPTLYEIVDGRRIYCHSRYNPLKEAEIFVKKYENVNCKRIDIIGFGLGYHVEKLLDVVQGCRINVLVLNTAIFKHALELSTGERVVKSKRVQFFLAQDAEQFSIFLEAMRTQEYSLIGIHDPSVKLMDCQSMDKNYLIEEFVMRINSSISGRELMEENFAYNKENFDTFVNSLYNKHIDKTIYIVSAGPSLEKNVDELKKIKKEDVIICVGRATKALITRNIYPTYISLLEANQVAYDKQIAFIDDEISKGIPIIIAASADLNGAKKYGGQIILACQTGFEHGEIFAAEHNIECIKTGGSVATMALDIAIRMKPRRIVFVGQDLAYTNLQTHESNLDSRGIVNTRMLREVNGIDGGTELTSKNLDSYRKWIQNRVTEADESIEFINATEGGAEILNVKSKRLMEIV